MKLLLTPTLPCDSVICTSQAAKTAFQNILDRTRQTFEGSDTVVFDAHTRFDVIPLGVDTDIYKPRDKQEIRHLLGLPQDKVILLYFGRIDHGTKADLAPLLLSFKNLLISHADKIVLVIAGAAKDDELISLTSIASQFGCVERLILRPNPTLGEAPLYYSAADIFVSLSDTLQESFGISPVEAMSSGLPVVVSDWSGYRETVVHDVTGYLVRTYWAKCDNLLSAFAPLKAWSEDHLHLSQSVAIDVDQLTHFLNELIVNRSQSLKMGEAGRKHVIENFNWVGVISRYKDLWEELAGIASRLPAGWKRTNNLGRPSYFESFKHFPTTCLIGTEVVHITELGRNFYRDPTAIHLYSEVGHTIDRRMLKIILRTTKMSDFLHYSLLIDDICDRIGPRHRQSREAMMTHIMWLIKYGCLRVEEPSPTPH